MKGYQLTKAFWLVCAHNESMQTKCTGNHHSLYTWICELRNQLQTQQSSREIMDLPVRYTMQMAFIGSDNTLKKCIEDLAEWGIIEIIQRGTNQHMPTKIKLIIENLLSQMCDSDAIALREQCDSSAIAPGSTKTVKTIKTKKTSASDAPDLFEVFWDTYDLKKDRKKTLEIWQKLSPKDRQAILDNVPGYVKANPNPQFRKMPKTYLNGECWKDPLVASSTSQQQKTVVY